MTALSLTLTGCATTTTPVDGPAAPASGGCSLQALGGLVGRPASGAIGADALHWSGARALRWIRPGDMVTMDYREDRLNIHLDAQNKVERFACG
jgi:hypothetical protein